jgi:hypothetical protein
MRRLARAMGVPAFGSLDLIRALDDEADVATAVASLRAHYVVDLPIEEPWHELAAEAGWNTNSPFATAISRPAAWRDVPKAFAAFRLLIFRCLDAADPETTTAWAHVAANGLAAAVAPTVRPRVVSALLAWVILFTDPFFTDETQTAGTDRGGGPSPAPGRVTEFVFTAAETIREQHYPDADALGSLVDALSQTLLNVTGPEATSRAIAALVGHLTDELGSRVFAAYLRAVATWS